MDSIKEIKEYIERNYSEKRKLHTEGVRKTAIELARKYGADEKKAEIAALFHDMYRGMPEKSLNYYVKNLGLDDKDDLRKARADGVVDGVFHQHLTVRADAVDLLISSIARAETRRHDDKGCVHCFSSFSAVGGGYAPRVYHILPRASRRIPGIPAKYRSYTAHFAVCAAAFRAQMHIFSTFYKKVTVL